MTKALPIAAAAGLSVAVACGLLAAPPAAVAADPAAAEPAFDGAKLFANSCGFCHSKGGRKAGKGPKLANSPRSDAYIVNRIKKGKPGRMPGYAAAFDDAKINAILVYIRSLDDAQ